MSEISASSSSHTRYCGVYTALLVAVLLHTPATGSSGALHRGGMPDVPKPAPAVVLSQRRPAHAINLTVIALRPYNISTLNDKDSADAAGDIFFYVGDTLPQKYACKRTSHAMGCGDNSILVHDQVYTVSALEIDSTYGETPSCNSGHACNKYQMCKTFSCWLFLSVE
jgi:hypothetical protein